jgi:hypothetical protein
MQIRKNAKEFCKEALELGIKKKEFAKIFALDNTLLLGFEGLGRLYPYI